MTANQIALSSLAMDLKRVALGYHRGAQETAERFAEEAIKRKEEITDAPPYLKKILKALPQKLSQKDKQELAEDTMMYSILFQNYVVKNL